MKKITNKTHGSKTTSALRVLKKVSGNSGALQEEIARARINAEVAQLIYDARTQAGYSQRELAELIGTKQPVIARLEDADYEGHSLTMLRKIAEALDRRLQITMPRLKRSLQTV